MHGRTASAAFDANDPTADFGCAVQPAFLLHNGRRTR
jgi:hypothetical protein